MKLYSLTVLYKTEHKVRSLKAAHDLQSFGYFQRGSVREFMDFTSRIVTERTSLCSRASVKEQEYMVHVYVRADGLAGVLIADHEYPVRVAFTLLNKVLDEFSEKFPKIEWGTVEENTVQFSNADDYLVKYQNPKEADAMTRLQADIDETKIILHNTIEAVLQRGEKLDDLVDKSEGLSTQSKAFYKTAKKTNSCCVIL
ncbi:synaptobrevin homolog YKT6-like [Lingula anatina]|uniref:Synaptobrevin homolog YKT6-like n=1 Tax=Lingula anatina TaxID=7574 RepID=A0A1S3HAC3_LINAN|nr:synaptobrevin homolog YKT6-like [Lingula anatina]XP_013401924.1 synaptobrevin homolog YKT6-like [Lingula anatina]|eukprot:XP_013383040.1 synaptobrevin homolog YKT6-like [Lingula anatina]